jgi:hypothetical protein
LIDEGKAERLGTLAKCSESLLALLLVILVGGLRGVEKTFLQGPVDEDGDLSSGGGDRLGLPDPDGKPTVEGPELVIAAANAHGGDAKEPGGAIGGRLGLRGEELAAGDLVVRREGEPGDEVLGGRPAVHVEADLGDQLQGVVRGDAGDLGEVDSPTEPVERGSKLELRVVPVGSSRTPSRPLRRGETGRGGLDRRLEGAEAGLDLGVAEPDLLLVEVEERDLLAQDEHMLVPVATGERGRDLLLRGLATVVPVAGELDGVGVAGGDVAEDGHARGPGEVADDVVELQVHEGQGLLHALDVGGRGRDELIAMPHERPDRRDLGRRAEAAPQESEGVELLDPLTVQDVRLAARDALDVEGVDEQNLEAAVLEDLEQGDPVDPGRLHGDGGDAAGLEPVGELEERMGEALELPNRVRVAIFRHRDPVAPRPDVDSGCVEVDLLEKALLAAAGSLRLRSRLRMARHAPSGLRS